MTFPQTEHESSANVANQPCKLYRHFDKRGVLLYVGISLDAVARLGQHKGAAWFDDIATITVKNFRSREAALRAERKAILTEDPIHNVAGRRSDPEPRTLTSADLAEFKINWTRGALELAASREARA